MTLFNFGAIRCASGNAIHISPDFMEFGTVGIRKMFPSILMIEVAAERS